MAEKRDLVLISPIGWDFLRQRFQQLASHLAKLGHRVLFIEPAISVLSPLRRPVLWQTWRRWFSGAVQPEPSLFCCSPPPAFLPFMNRHELISSANQRLLAAWVKRQAKKLGFKEYGLIIFPVYPDLPGRCGEAVSVYDCADEHSAFDWVDKELYTRQELQLVEKAGKVTATARLLQEKLSAYNPVLIPNGVVPEDWQKETELPVDLAGIRKPWVGYWGTFSSWFDYEMLEELARNRPDVSIVLIGNKLRSERIDKLSGYDNVHFLGLKNYAELAAYGQRFEVLLLPFLLNDVTKATNPVKLYEYLSCGKPVVASRLPELEVFSDVVRLADTPTQFVESVDEALAEGDALSARRKEYALRNSWAERARVMSETVG